MRTNEDVDFGIDYTTHLEYDFEVKGNVGGVSFAPEVSKRINYGRFLNPLLNLGSDSKEQALKSWGDFTGATAQCTEEIPL